MPESFITKIKDLSSLGTGVGESPEGKIVFVPYTHPGDTVKVKIIKNDKKFAIGQAIDIVDPATERETPACQYFGKCGGCELQHVRYDRQWQNKLKYIRECLQRQKIAIEAIEFIEFPAPKQLGFRNRIHLKIHNGRAGYFAKGSHKHIAIDSCAIAEQPINEALRTLSNEHWGKYSQVEIEHSNGDVLFHWDKPPASDGFRQVYDEQNQMLQNWVVNQLSGGNRLLDLFGGSANLSKNLIGKFTEIHCVDLTVKVCSDQIHFHKSDVLSWLEDRLDLHASAVILDPPRAGLGPSSSRLIECLNQMGLREVLLVGCNPVKWAHDLANFLSAGWTLTQLGALDFFPQTHHVEALAKVEKL